MPTIAKGSRFTSQNWLDGRVNGNGVALVRRDGGHRSWNAISPMIASGTLGWITNESVDTTDVTEK